MTENILKSYFSISHDETFPPGKKKTIETAIKLFAKQGYHGTSTLQIAKEAGVSQATVFKYFKTKEDLLYSIIVPVIPKLFLNFLNYNFYNKIYFIKLFILILFSQFQVILQLS